MEEQIAPKSTEQVQGSKVIWTITISVVITAILVGSGIYLWRQSSLETTEQKLQQQIAELQNQINGLEKESSELETTEQPVSTTPSEKSNGIDLPVVAYSRAGLFNNTEEGRIEKDNFEKKLVNPFIDYYSENRGSLVAMHITIPSNVGEKYGVVAIFVSETQDERASGTTEFSFGAREEEYGYWEPDCMGPCDFSEEFKAKYPEIVK